MSEHSFIRKNGGLVNTNREEARAAKARMRSINKTNELETKVQLLEQRIALLEEKLERISDS